MKKCTFLTFLFYLFFMSTNLLASDPNFDTVRGMIYTFPRVTVDNSSAYLNVQVQLNPNGTWSVLNATEEDSETSSIQKKTPKLRQYTYQETGKEGLTVVTTHVIQS